MSVTRLNSDTIRDYANKVVKILRMSDAPVSKQSLCEQLGLTTGQVSSVMKYMRRCAEQDFYRFIPFYPISSKSGYSFMKKPNDFLPCFLTLEEWSGSVRRTIAPMRRYLEENGVNIEAELEFRRNDPDYGNYLNDVPDMAEDAWHHE